MTLDILTPEQSLFSGTADRVQLPGINGKFEVLDNHAPMIATIKEGKIKVTFNSAGKSGHTMKTVTVTCNTEKGVETINIKTFIREPKKQ